MKDVDKLKALLDEFGVHYREEEFNGDLHIEIHADDEDKGKNGGYTGFVSAYVFDKDGKFQIVEIWE